jgi:phenylalanine-4-hydroxylase
MVVGGSLVSAFSGIADPNSYGLEFEVPREKTHKIRYSEKDLNLFSLYGEVRRMREEGSADESRLAQILDRLESEYPKDWLLSLGIYELASENEGSDLFERVRKRLEALAKDEKTGHLVRDGLQLVSYT